MIDWKKRSPEIANLLNPPFCALILYSAVLEYQKKEKTYLPITLLYLVLPLILHQSTRNELSSRTNMVVWLQKNPKALIGFSKRARDLVPFTNEAFEFLLHQQIIDINGGKVHVIKKIPKSKLDKFISEDQEIEDCVNKAAHVGRWFLHMKTEENIYAAWGVKP